jgi:hypothetical protein
VASLLQKQVWYALDRELFVDGTADATLVTLRQTQLPLQGWAGWVDWRMGGLLSEAIRKAPGVLEPGTFTLLADSHLPVSRRNPDRKALQVLLQIQAKTPATKNSAVLRERLLKLGASRRWAIPPSEVGSSEECLRLTREGVQVSFGVPLSDSRGGTA